MHTLKLGKVTDNTIATIFLKKICFHYCYYRITPSSKEKETLRSMNSETLWSKIPLKVRVQKMCDLQITYLAWQIAYLTCQLPHIWGIFNHFGLNIKFVTHCHTFCGFATHFWRNATHFNDFCPMYSLLLIEGHGEFGLPRINLSLRSLFDNVWLASLPIVDFNPLS